MVSTQTRPIQADTSAVLVGLLTFKTVLPVSFGLRRNYLVITRNN